MSSVFVLSDDREFTTRLKGGYESLGVEVLLGKNNIRSSQMCPGDIIHILWPEEFFSWRAASREAVDSVIEDIRALKNSGVRCVFSVNNLKPHDPRDPDLSLYMYQRFLDVADGVVHHSRASLHAVREMYEVADSSVHIVSHCINYNDLRSSPPSTKGLSKKISLLTFGAIRSRRELSLIIKSYLIAKKKNPYLRLTMANRYEGRGEGRLSRLLSRLALRCLSRPMGIRYEGRFIADHEIQSIFDKSDILLITRIDQLSSGTVGLAATFGIPVVAPDVGAFPEYVEGTGSGLYKAGDPCSLSDAILTLSEADLGKVGAAMLRLSSVWTWGSFAQACLRAARASQK